MTQTAHFVALVLMVFIVQSLSAQHLKSGPQVLTFHSQADDTEQPYALYIPKNFDENKVYPLVIMLHGAGSNHRLALRRVFGKSNAEGESDVEASRYFPEWDDVPFLVAAPFARGTAGYQGVVEQDVYAVLDNVRERFNVDPDRTYLTGLSMGGGGTLWLGLTRPDVWAALAAVCPAPPGGTSALLGNAANLPVHFFHGDADPVVPIAGTRSMVEEMQNLGIHVVSEEYEGVRHDSWVNAYAEGRIFDWLGQFSRNRYPEHVSFTTHTLRHNRAYWVEITQLNPGAIGKVEARIADTQRIEITTDGIEGLDLKLEGHPMIDSETRLEIVLDGKSVKLMPQSTLSFYKDNDAWQIGSLVKAKGKIKREGLSGPVFEAFSDRHVYVYGTADNPSPEVVEKRRQTAYEAANWSVYRGEFLGRIMFFPRVLSDREVRESDLESSHLILFGDRITNSIIQQLSNELPLQLSSTADGYGLLYIYPRNDKYVVINSGLPWWGGKRFPGFSFVAEPHQRLSTFKDFVLFQGTPDSVITDGYFDNQWQVDREGTRKILELEVLELK